ncbi:MAG TPA: hypothetical protein VK996_17530 [Ramlibacter sp.]|nr:hypothetical protein [Ramlibacter sp.]
MAVGGIIGWLAAITIVSAAGNKTVILENVLVGMFGAFIGGDFVAALLNGGVVNDKVFKLSSLMLAGAGALVLLLVLKLMRHVVGPMKAGKSKKRN